VLGAGYGRRRRRRLTAAGAALLVATGLACGASSPALAAPWQPVASFQQCNATHNWEPFGSPYQSPQFRTDSGGFVHLRGAVKCATAATLDTLFILPDTSSPLEPEDFPVASGDGAGNYDDYPWVHINTTGEVNWNFGSSGGLVSLSGVQFADAKWKKPTLQQCKMGSDWTSHTNEKAGYVRDADGVVHLRGDVTCFAQADRLTIFMLPEGNRPAKRELFTTVVFPSVAAAVIEVDPDGSVIAGGALGDDDLTLSGIAFNADGAPTTGTWTKPTLGACGLLTTHWEKFGGGYQVPAYRKDSHGFVHLRGLAACSGTVAASTLFVLPAGFAPPAKEVFPIASGDGTGTFSDAAVIEVGSNGTVTATGGYDGRAVSLSPITFDTKP
jgi:hypothetical protein